MGFFKDSKPPKTEAEKFRDWINDFRVHEDKEILVMRTQNPKWKFVSKLIGLKYELIGQSEDHGWSHGYTFVFRQPSSVGN